MYLLDTDTYSLYLSGQEEVVKRFRRVELSRIYLSEITVSEILKGRLAYIKECGLKGGHRLVSAYGFLTHQLIQFDEMNIVPYNREADAYFATYDAKIRRAGTNDCRIAAIAHVQGLIVVTANRRHFDAIGCRHEDWTRAE